MIEIDVFPTALIAVGVVAALAVAFFLGIEVGKDREKKGEK